MSTSATARRRLEPWALSVDAPQRGGSEEPWAGSGPFLPAPGERGEIERLCATGLLRRLIGDVVVAADVAVTAEVRARAAWLLVPARLRAVGAALGEFTAAWVYAGGALPDGSSSGADGSLLPVVAICPTVRWRPNAPEVVVRQLTLDPSDVHLVGDTAVTSPARTAADLARILPGQRCLPVLRALEATTGVTAAQVRQRLDAMAGFRGITGARVAVQRWDASPAIRRRGPGTTATAGQESGAVDEHGT